MTGATRTLGPWRAGQLRVACLAQLLALAVVAVASVGVIHTAGFDEQTDWLNVAIAGVALAAITAGAWLQVGRRRVVARRTRLATANASVLDRPIARDAATPAPVATPAMSHYHRESCQLVRGKGAAPAPVIEHHRAERTPCAVCRP
jgi:hypothetical protein